MARVETFRNALSTNHLLHWYRIERVLGQGGFGITYLAYDTNLQQEVAIKEYLPMELAVREGDNSVFPVSDRHGDRFKWGLDRFLTEARTLAKFRHPGIVRVLSVFEANNTAYMVMEYERGETLQELLSNRKTLRESEIDNILAPLLDGLEQVHSTGFIHRDIKPANIFLRENGTAVLIDFGSARQALGLETRTLTSIVSPGYAPYEQYYSKSDKQGPWTDIYGLAATLYRAVSGRIPPNAIDRSESILKAERDALVTAAEIGEGRYRKGLLEAIDHGLRFNEKDRPQSIAEWRTELYRSAPLDAGVPLSDARTRFGPQSQVPTEIATEDAFRPRSKPTTRLPTYEPTVAVPPRKRTWLKHAVQLIVVAAAVLAAAWFGTRYRGALPWEQAREHKLGMAPQPPAVQTDVRSVEKPQAETLKPLESAAPSPSPAPAAAAPSAASVSAPVSPPPVAAEASPIVAAPPSPAGAAVNEIPAPTAAESSASAPAPSSAASAVVNESPAASSPTEAPTASENPPAAAPTPAAGVAAKANPPPEPSSPGNTTTSSDASAATDTGPAATEAAAAEAEAEKNKSEIAEMLKLAQADLKANRLSTPKDSNALDRYEAVLQRDPQNSEAQDGIAAVAERYAALAAISLDNGDLDKAGALLERGRNAKPDAASLDGIAKRLQAARQAAAQAAQVQAAKEAAAKEQAQIEQAAREQAARDAAAKEQAAREQAAKEQAAREQAAKEQAEKARLALAQPPAVAFMFDGFKHDYDRYGLSESKLRQEAAERLQKAGYAIADGSGPVNLYIRFKFRVAVNTTNGLASYSTHLDVAGAPWTPTSTPLAQWQSGQSGTTRINEIGGLNDIYMKLIDRFIQERPPKRQ